MAFQDMSADAACVAPAMMAFILAGNASYFVLLNMISKVSALW